MKQYSFFFLIGWTIAPIVQWIEKYMFSDWEFLKFLAVITIVDTILGLVKAIKYKEVSSKGFSMVFYKIIVYSCALITSHVLVHFSISNKQYALFNWFDSVVFSAIIVREAISIFENIALIDPKAFPRYILKYLKDFDNITGRKKLQGNSNGEEPIS